MTDDELMEHVLRARAQGSDDARVEIKAASKQLPKSVWETVSAFANTKGGIIILGLEEKTGFKPVPDFKAQPILDAFLTGMRADPKVEPIPKYETQYFICEGETLVAIKIDSLVGIQSERMPCFVKSQGVTRGSYRRVHDQDQHLTEYEIYLFHSDSLGETVDDKPVPKVRLEELSAPLVQGLIQRQKFVSSSALRDIDLADVPAILARLKVLTRDQEVTLAGYLALASYPQQEFPQLFIDIAVHPGEEKSTDREVRFYDRIICEGPIPVMVEDTLKAVTKHLSIRRVVQGSSGRDVLEVPEEVLREAITNAVMHRDYSHFSRGQQVAVDIFADRIEISNPGGFMGGIGATGMLEIPTRSDSRNPTLAKILTTTPKINDGGTVCENQGSGIAYMFNVMRDNDLPVPDYSGSTLTQVVLKLYRHKRETGARGGASDLSDAQLALLQQIPLEKPVSIREIADITGKSIGYLRNLVRELVDAGALEATAPVTSKSREYRRLK